MKVRTYEDYPGELQDRRYEPLFEYLGMHISKAHGTYVVNPEGKGFVVRAMVDVYEGLRKRFERRAKRIASAIREVIEG